MVHAGQQGGISLSRADDDPFFAAVMEVAIDVFGFGPDLETDDERQTCLRDYNEAERTVVSTWSVYNEVYNGGFGQLYANSTGMWAPESVAAFRRIGSPPIPDGEAAVSSARRRDFLKNNKEADAHFEDLNGEFVKVQFVRFARDPVDKLGIPL
jgi:hypothetical protein